MSRTTTTLQTRTPTLQATLVPQKIVNDGVAVSPPRVPRPQHVPRPQRTPVRVQKPVDIKRLDKIFTTGDAMPASLDIVEKLMVQESITAIAERIAQNDQLIMRELHDKNVKKYIELGGTGVDEYVTYSPLNYVLLTHKLEVKHEEVNVPLLASRYKAYVLTGCLIVEIMLTHLPKIKSLVAQFSPDYAEKIPSFISGINTSGLTQTVDAAISLFLPNTFEEMARANYRANRKAAMSEDLGLGLAPKHNVWLWILMAAIMCIVTNSTGIDAMGALRGIKEFKDIFSSGVEFNMSSMMGYGKRIYEAFMGTPSSAPKTATAPATVIQAASVDADF